MRCSWLYRGRVTAENRCGVAHPVWNYGLDLTSCDLSATQALMLTHQPRSRPSRVRSGGTCVSPSSGWWGGWRPPPGTANSRCLRRSPTGPGRKQQTRCSATSAPSCHIGSYHSLNSRVGAPPAERRAGREKRDRQVNHKRLDERKEPSTSGDKIMHSRRREIGRTGSKEYIIKTQLDVFLLGVATCTRWLQNERQKEFLKKALTRLFYFLKKIQHFIRICTKWSNPN